MKELKLMLTLFTVQEKRKLLFLILGLSIGALLEAVGVSAILPLVQVMADPQQFKESFVYQWITAIIPIQSTAECVGVCAGFLIILYIVKNIYLFCLQYLQNRFIFGLRKKISKRLYHNILAKPYAWFLKENTYDIITKIAVNMGKMFDYLRECMIVLSELMLVAMVIIYLMRVDFVTIVIIGAVLLASYFCIIMKVRRKTEQWGRQNSESSTELYAYVQQSIVAVKEIKATQQEHFFEIQFDKCCEKNTSSTQKFLTAYELPRYFIEAAGVTVLLLIILVRAELGKDLQSMLPQLSVLGIAALRLLPSVNKISSNFTQMSFNKVVIRELVELCSPKEEISGRKEEISGSGDFLQQRSKLRECGDLQENVQDIVLKHVSFSYESDRKETHIVNDLSLTIPGRASIAIVGTSGAGKTTLIDLILGILQPDNGEIFYGGKRIMDPGCRWHQKVGYIPQDIFILDDTIRRNVALGEEVIEEEKVWSALEAAQLADFVRGLPQGLDTECGERGMRMSGGQRQRIGIARALYHNPPILVLDEATSALDVNTERMVMNAVEQLKGDKTVILVTHRLSTAQSCDQIYQIQDGRLEEVRKDLSPDVVLQKI